MAKYEICPAVQYETRTIDQRVLILIVNAMVEQTA